MTTSVVDMVTMEGNEACAHVAYRVNEVCGIYPITPSSPMAELADQWASEGLQNIWGTVPDVVEMQSEAGAAGTVHGALQGGALTTTFTASQGLLLMIPNMYKIAGELTPAVFHVAARSLAAQGLSIFGDHQDVMAVRQTGFALLASASVQEAHDMALIAQASTLAARVPFVHFFDGFRTSHEINKIALLSDDEIRAMVDDEQVLAHRRRALNPDNPVIRGTAQNPDVYFQARETVNPYYDAVPGIVEQAMASFAGLTGRHYDLVDYIGHPEAERVIVIMGSGAETAAQTARYLSDRGERVGVLQVRLYRPFPTDAFIEALPVRVESIAVLDRTKEPGAAGDPLLLDVVTTLYDMPGDQDLPIVIGGRYGLSSKEFTPAMVKGIFDELGKRQPKRRFTIGINDDVGNTSLPYDSEFDIEGAGVTRAMFFGLGADGTVGANKNSIKILGEDPSIHAQAYFVYDSKKSGSRTVSHLRFGPEPIKSPYLIPHANFIGCHQFQFLHEIDVLGHAADGALLLLNSSHSPDEVWSKLPRDVQRAIIDKHIRLFVIDAAKVARHVGMRGRINTVMQTCFFAISGVMERDRAIEKIKAAIEKTYGKKGADVIRRNFEAVDQALAHLHEVNLPVEVTSTIELSPPVADTAPAFVRDVTATMMAGRGDELPVSALPVDGTFPTGTAAFEKRNVSDTVPVWQPDICIQCGNCSFVCPHGVIRSKFFNENALDKAPAHFHSAPINARGFPETRYTLQIYAEDCTGCSLCVEACPVQDKECPGQRAINMAAKAPILKNAKEDVAFFETLPINDRSTVSFSTVRGVQFLEPLFEFSGACSGCGETPYVKLVSQLFGDRLLVANATGCSSIYGGNLPTTPWTKNAEGRGPAWSNSLFEDNAEFGLGMRLAADKHHDIARQLLRLLAHDVGDDLVEDILTADQRIESEIRAQRARVATLRGRLAALVERDNRDARHLLSVADHLVRRSVWLMGGDGWAYDIGSAGLDHVLSTGRDVNVLVMDTEVYSNTGGQMSKATPLAAVAKFANAGKHVGKKDLALQAISYGNVYVARIAMGANPQQTLQALREAEAYPGPSLILAYSHCIAHGIDMKKGLAQQDLAVHSGYWPLIRYNPEIRRSDGNPFILDSLRPNRAFKDYAGNELRYRVLQRTNPEEADQLMARAEAYIRRKWDLYEVMATSGNTLRLPPNEWMNEERSAVMKLDTTYLGLPLKHPIVASAGPISQTLDGIRQLEDGNAAAIVLSSLFEEQIRAENELAEQRLSAGVDSFGESLSYFPDVAERAAGPEDYLTLVRNAVDVTDVPIIASLNGMTNEGWVDYARLLQDAGADALELNVYYIPADVDTMGADVEQRYVEVLDAVKSAVTIPVAIKLGPYFSAFGSMARILVDAGADGLVLFNRFYQPDIDLETLSITPSLDLSESNEIRLPLLWIGVLAGRVDASIAATSGVRTSEQVIKYLLAGADVVMTTSSILRNGPRHMADLVRGLAQWMVDKGYDDVGQLRGAMSQRQVQDPAAFERANYIKVLQSY